jgi:TPR repeat protein
MDPVLRPRSPLLGSNLVLTRVAPQPPPARAAAAPDRPSTLEEAAGPRLAPDPRPQASREEAKASQIDETALLARAEAFLARDDVVGARLLLEHAASTGNALALFKLAETYDPRNPIVRRVGGALGDRDRAVQLYADAASAGYAGVEDRISALR